MKGVIAILVLSLFAWVASMVASWAILCFVFDFPVELWR